MPGALLLILQGTNAATALPVASALAIIQAPTGATSGSFMIPIFRVQVRDQFGNPFPGTYTITAAIGSGTGTITSGGSVLITSATTADFSQLIITAGSTGSHTVTFSSGSLTTATSASFTVTVPGVPIGPIITAAGGRARRRRFGGQ